MPKTLAKLSPREKPDVATMITEIRDAVNSANALGIFQKMAVCHHTRNCWWRNQQKDGRKPAPKKGTKDNLYFWEGAPETRRHKCDEIVLERAGLRQLVLYRGQVRVSPGLADLPAQGDQEGQSATDHALPGAATGTATGAATGTGAGAATSAATGAATGAGSPDGRLRAEGLQVIADHFANEMSAELEYAWELFSVCVEELGYSCLYAGWEEEESNERREVTRSQFMEAVVNEIAGDSFGTEGGTRRREGAENEGASESLQLQPEELQQVQMQAELLWAGMMQGDEEMVLAGRQFLLQMDPAMSETEAGAVLRQWRKRGDYEGLTAESTEEDCAYYFVPSSDGGKVLPEGLIPWVNFLHPASLTGGGRMDWGAVPEWITEVTLMSASRGYRKGWRERVKAHANKSLPELMGLNLDGANAWVLNGAGIGLHLDHNYLGSRQPMYQVLHVWRRAVDSQGRTTVFVTTLHPMIDDDFGAHEATGLTRLPFLVKTAEPVYQAMLSRGVGEIVVAGQNQVIDLMDSEGARAQLGSNPPLKRGMDVHVAVRPGMQMFVRGAGVRDATEFMKTPEVDQGSLKLIELAERFIDERFFRAATTDPDTKQAQRELLAYRSMGALSEFWRMIMELLQAELGEAQATRLAGRPMSLSGAVNVQIAFNVAGLGQDATDSWISVVEKLLNIDPGVIDRSALVEDILWMKNPAVARKILMSQETASERIRGDQQLRISKMMGGWKPQQADYPQRQTNPQMRIEEMQAYMQDPWNQQRMMAPQNGDAMEMMQKEMKYLQDQIQQYQKNAMIGKSVVQAEAPAAAEPELAR